FRSCRWPGGPRQIEEVLDVFQEASMSAALAVAAAVIFTWLGAVLAISFLEAPLKFRAPDVTIRIGLGIGRLVFRALNTVEVVLAGVLIVALVLAAPGIAVAAGAAVTIAVLA